MDTQAWTKNSFVTFKEDYRPGGSIIKFLKGSGFFVSGYDAGFVEILSAGMVFYIPEDKLQARE